MPATRFIVSIFLHVIIAGISSGSFTDSSLSFYTDHQDYCTRLPSRADGRTSMSARVSRGSRRGWIGVLRLRHSHTHPPSSAGSSQQMDGPPRALEAAQPRRQQRIQIVQVNEQKGESILPYKSASYSPATTETVAGVKIVGTAGVKIGGTDR